MDLEKEEMRMRFEILPQNKNPKSLLTVLYFFTKFLIFHLIYNGSVSL